MDCEVAEAFEETVRALEGLGHQVADIEMPGVLPAPELIDAIAGEVAEVHRRFREDGLPYGADVARRVDDCLDTGPDRIDAGRAWQAMIRSRFADAFEGVDLLITPTTPVMRKIIGEDMIGDRHYRVSPLLVHRPGQPRLAPGHRSPAGRHRCPTGVPPGHWAARLRDISHRFR